MKRLTSILSILAALASVLGCDTSGNVDPVFKKAFIKYYGTDGDQSAADLLVNPLGEIFLLGNSQSLDGTKSAFLIKTDIEGNVIWERQIGGEDESAVDIELINEGGNAGNLAVALNIGPENSSRIRVLRIAQDGSGIDSVVLPLHKSGGYMQVAKSITPLTDADEYIVTGYADQILIKETSPIDAGNDITDILAFKLDNNLSLIDTVVTKGGERNGSGIKVFELPENVQGNLVLFSFSDRPFTTNNFGFNFSFDIISSGIPVGKLIGTENDQEILASVVKVPLNQGGGFLLAGTSMQSLSGAGDPYLVKYDNDLQYKSLDLKLSLGKNLQCVAADYASMGYYILCNEMSAGSLNDLTLLKVRGDGGVDWTRSFGTKEGDDTGAAITTLPDGRIAIAATMGLQTKKKLALIMLNSDGSF